MEIKLDIRNDLFKRNEIEAIVEAEKNPSFEEISKMISEEVKKPEENIDVYNVIGGFGRSNFVIKGYVYDSKEDLKKAEQKTQKQRKAEAALASVPSATTGVPSGTRTSEDVPSEGEGKGDEGKAAEEKVKVEEAHSEDKSVEKKKEISETFIYLNLLYLIRC